METPNIRINRSFFRLLAYLLSHKTATHTLYFSRLLCGGIPYGQDAFFLCLQNTILQGRMFFLNIVLITDSTALFFEKLTQRRHILCLRIYYQKSS